MNKRFDLELGLYAGEDTEIPAYGLKEIRTVTKKQVPADIDATAEMCDYTYIANEIGIVGAPKITGKKEVCLILCNNGDWEFNVLKGDRLASLNIRDINVFKDARKTKNSLQK